MNGIFTLSLRWTRCTANGLAGMQRRDAIDHVKPVNVLLFILICLFIFSNSYSYTLIYKMAERFHDGGY